MLEVPSLNRHCTICVFTTGIFNYQSDLELIQFGDNSFIFSWSLNPNPIEAAKGIEH